MNQYFAFTRIPVRVKNGAACAVMLLVGLCIPGQAKAGGYLVMTGTSAAPAPAKWANTVVMNFDQGPLGTLSNAQADTMANAALQRWSNNQIPTCILTLQQSPSDLSIDHGASNGSAANNPAYYDDFTPDGISPMIYDQFGFLIDTALGAGNSNFVIGFAGPKWSSGATIIEGRAVINGRFIDGGVSPADLSYAQMEGVVTHEIGHMLNLDHAQGGVASTNTFNGTSPNYEGFPTMYPLAHADVGDLELDDRVWISNLYPSLSNNTAKFRGTVTTPAGAKINGVNIVARNAADPQQVITCVCGFHDHTPTVLDNSARESEFEIPGIAAGTQWVIDWEQIAKTFTGGSRVGPISPPLVVDAPTEFLNTTESNSDPLLVSETFPAPPANSVKTVNLQLNNFQPDQVLNEPIESSGNFSNQYALNFSPGTPVLVNGSMNPAEAGSLTFFTGEDIEDYYYLNAPAAVELQSITLTPAADQNLDLYILASDGASVSGFFARNGGVGVAETLEGFYDSSNFGGGAFAGRIIIGVKGFGSAVRPYTMKIKTSVSDNDALVVNYPASVNPTGGSIVLTGRGFKNSGGSPTVQFSDPGIQVNSVTYNSPTQITSNVSRLAGFVPGGQVGITVTNQAGGGSYSGTVQEVSAVPVSLSGFSLD